jgi:mannose-6-phosphate isomerase-like protein (cupin superfamily)
MRITRLEDAPIVMSNDDFTGRRLYAFPSATLIHMTVNPGRGIEPHSADAGMGFYVVRGIGLFSIGSEEGVAEAGAFVESPAGIPHGIANLGEGPLDLLVVKASASSLPARPRNP